ncbi:MAG: Alpha/Beta hydrolase protein [Linnemannia gamsii]|nr:MAG: Alpha/Beta hydrolase protein [Linnemannia gamsii]
MIPDKYRHIGTNPTNQYGLDHSEKEGLNLNIFVPLSALQDGAKPIPVMTYIYGGGNHARNLVQHSVQLGQPILIVQPNYRLAAFGFLASKELQEDMDEYVRNSPCPVPLYNQSVGNWGLQDQKLAFEWVRENISALGGDNKNVTAFGQSVGAISLHYHIVLPSYYGLFDRAILQSGAIGTMSTGTVTQVGQPIFDRLIEILGIPPALSGPDKVKRLREIPIDELTRASDEAGPRFGYRPFHDGGKILPFNIPVESWTERPTSYDPGLKAVLIGANKDEGYSLDADFGECNLKTWSRLINSFVPSPELVPLYEAAYGVPRTDEDVRRIMTEHLGDIVFHYPIERAVDALVQVKKREEKERVIRSHWRETLKDHPLSGSMHGGELLYVFNPPMNEQIFTNKELAAALEVEKRWITFAYQQPLISNTGKGSSADKDEAIVLTRDYNVEVGKGRLLSEKVVSLWSAALEHRLREIQESLDASIPREE